MKVQIDLDEQFKPKSRKFQLRLSRNHGSLKLKMWKIVKASASTAALQFYFYTAHDGLLYLCSSCSKQIQSFLTKSNPCGCLYPTLIFPAPRLQSYLSCILRVDTSRDADDYIYFNTGMRLFTSSLLRPNTGAGNQRSC